MKVELPKTNPNHRFVRLTDVTTADFYYMDQRALPLMNVCNDTALAHWTHMYLICKAPGYIGATPEAKRLIASQCEIVKRNQQAIEYKDDRRIWLDHLSEEFYDARDYQLAGMNRLWCLHHAILGDDTGLGKTPMSLAVMARGLFERVGGCGVVVTTASTKGQWVDEINKFTPQLKVQLIDGNKVERTNRWKQPADIYVASYEYLRMLEDFAMLKQLNPFMIIFDEAYRLGGRNSITHQNAVFLSQQVERCVLCHATPIERGLENIYALMELMDNRIFGGYDQFQTRFMQMKPRPAYLANYVIYCPKVDKYVNLQDFRFRIFKHLVRRTVGDVKLQLPDVVTLPIYTELSAADSKAYKQQVKQCLNDRVPNIAALRVSMAASKINDLKARMQGELAGEKIIVFSQYATVINMANQMLSEFQLSVITGSVSSEDRRAIIRNFADSNRSALLMTEAGSRGLNLQAARVIINIDLPWTHAQLRQRVGRVCRIGQKADSVLVMNYVGCRRGGKYTVDHWLLSIINDRRDLHTKVLRDDYQDEIGVDEITPLKFKEILRGIESGQLEFATAGI